MNKSLSEIKKMTRKRTIRVWTIGVILTVLIIWGEAFIGRGVVRWVSIDITMWQSILAVILTNVLIGFYKGIKLYGKKENKKNKGEAKG